jgi:hypothetical protein
MNIALDTAVGKEAFVNIIVAMYVAPCYLVSLCESFEKPAASMFKAENLKKRGHFLSKTWYIIYNTALQHFAKVSKLRLHRFILKKSLDSIFEAAFHRFAIGTQRKTSNV